MRILVFLSSLLVLASCKQSTETIGTIERYDPSIDSLISPQAVIEVIDKGFDWAEGPLWLEDQKVLLFTDVPQNKVYAWTEGRGTILYLNPAGYTGQMSRLGEMGANGLTLDQDGKLILCQHGDRRLARMDATLLAPASNFITITDQYNGKRYNSPNDVARNGSGFLFTDPPYGLEKRMDDPAKELAFQGVYRVDADGTVALLTDTLTRPNGISVGHDGSYVIVANSDPEKARWYRYGFDGKTFTSGAVMYDATSLVGSNKGLPDGLKIDAHGNLFATGPGGVFIFNAAGKLIGKIRVPEATSNCALTPDGKTLFITNDMNLLRVKLR